METNWRRIIIYLLIVLTIGAIIFAVVLSIRLKTDTTGNGTTQIAPSIIPTSSGSVSNVDLATCAGKNTTTASIKCKKDDSTVCSSTNGDSVIQNLLVGQEVCTNGDVGKCDFYAACAPTVQEGMSCSSQYPGLNEPIQKLSNATFSEGGFIGCDINNQINNCFCQLDSSNNLMSTASITCAGDKRVNGEYNFCGSRTYSGGSPVIGSITPSPSVLVPTVVFTPSIVPTSSGLIVCPTAPICSGELRVNDLHKGSLGECTTYTCIPNISATPLVSPSIIPDTALTSSDQADRLLLGILLIVSSLLIYYFKLQSTFGKKLFNMIGRPFLGNIKGIEDEYITEQNDKFKSDITNSSK